MHRVVACPRCRKARIVEAGAKTATCAHCGGTLRMEDLAVAHATADLEEARHAVGVLNARLAGDAGAYAEALALAAPRAQGPPRHDDALDRAAARARPARGEAARADAVARALGEFDAGTFAEALERAGLRRERADAHLARMLAAHVVHEPRAGRYRAL